jgi:hypothetical protein
LKLSFADEAMSRVKGVNNVTIQDIDNDNLTLGGMLTI